MPNLPYYRVILNTYDKTIVEQIIQLSQKFFPANQITTHLHCDACDADVYSNEYPQDYPICGAALWV